MPILRVPEGLRRYVGGAGSITVAGRTVGEALAAAAAAHPDLRPRLLGEDDRLRPYLLAFRNDDQVPQPGLEEAALEPGDILTILEAVGGGV